MDLEGGKYEDLLMLFLIMLIRQVKAAMVVGQEDNIVQVNC